MQLASQILTPVSPTGSILANIHQTISELIEYVRSIADSLPKLPPVDQAVTFSGAPIQLSRDGRRYGLIWLSQPATLIIDVPRMVQCPLTLEAGWNEFTLPSDTKIALADGSSISAIYRCTDTREVG